MHTKPELPRPSNQISRLVSSTGAFELQRQIVLAALEAKLSLRVRGIDSEPVDICYGFVHSWIGECLIAWTELGICWLEPQPGPRSLAELEQTWSPARLTCSQTAAGHYARDNLATERSDLSLHLCGTAFQLQVWAALLRIRPGYYLHYGDLAHHIGKPGAARALGQAVGANPVSVFVPCHRVLAAGGRLGGYRWGSDLKLALLRREAAGRSANAFT
jgi:AraC family transcriptional regulator, regulatory protein of adaptative response / methylated-DNA-[protein]-cysteine methyltransferase